MGYWETWKTFAASRHLSQKLKLLKTACFQRIALKTNSKELLFVFFVTFEVLNTFLKLIYIVLKLSVTNV